MEGKIYLSEEVENKDFRFGQQLSYIPAVVVDPDGVETPVLFTRHQLKEARERAAENPEDLPEKKSFLERIFG